MTTAEIYAMDDDALLSLYSHNSSRWFWTKQALQEQRWIRAELLKRMQKVKPLFGN